MSAADTVYQGSPVWLQNAMVAAYGWWWYRRRLGPHFQAHVRGLKERERWTEEEVAAYQDQQLAQVLRSAHASPYYQSLFAQVGVTPATPPREALARLPVLSKQQLRSDATRLLTAPPPRSTVVFRSSGTTGTPTDIYYSPEFHALETATIEARNLNWGGTTFGARRVMFGARKICRFTQKGPPFWRLSPAENMAYASVYHLTPAFLPAYMRFLRAFRPTVVMGYPSALYTIAEYACATGDFPAPAHGVFTSAETLHDHMRAAIERAWQCRVFDRYGAVEGCVVASQCEYGRYHVSSDVGLVEIVDPEGRPAAPGVSGDVVCTGLHNRLQPLLRYRIGDRARWSVDQQCDCGRALPLIEGIDGRIEDMCYTEDGRRILRFDTVFKGVESIREAQVIQEAIDRFTIAVVPASGFSEREKVQLHANMALHVGEVAVEIKCVPAIPKTSGGKFQAVVCRLSAADKERYGRAAALR